MEASKRELSLVLDAMLRGFSTLERWAVFLDAPPFLFLVV